MPVQESSVQTHIENLQEEAYSVLEENVIEVAKFLEQEWTNSELVREYLHRFSIPTPITTNQKERLSQLVQSIKARRDDLEKRGLIRKYSTIRNESTGHLNNTYFWYGEIYTDEEKLLNEISRLEARIASDTIKLQELKEKKGRVVTSATTQSSRQN